MLQRQLIMTN